MDHLKIHGRDKSSENVFKLFESWLWDSEKGSWLLIMDNVDDAGFLLDPPVRSSDARHRSKRLIEYLPSREHGSVLITTRSKAAALKFVEQRHIIQVDPMNEIQAIELLERKLDHRSEREELARLARSLDFMPLALTQAAAFMRHRAPRYSIEQYLESFEKSYKSKPSLLIDRTAGDLRRDREAKNSILTTWQISFEHVQATKPSAARLLSLMSLCDRNGIQESLLRSPYQTKGSSTDASLSSNIGCRSSRNSSDVDSDNDTLSSVVEDDDFEDDITTLRQFSFVSLTVDSSVFEMHRLVQLATRTWLKSQKQLETVKDSFCYRLSQVFNSVEYENWKVCEMYFPHVKSLMEFKPQNGDGLLRWSAILSDGAKYAWSKGDILDAESMAAQSLDAREKLLGSEDWRTVRSMEFLALAKTMTGDWQTAVDLEENILEVNNKIFGDQDKRTIVSMANLAHMYTQVGRFHDAEALHLQAVEKLKRTSDEGDEYTLQTMGNLAEFYHSRWRLEDAENLHKQVVEAMVVHLGEEHPSTILAMSNLAVVYQRRKRWAEAEELESKVVEISKRILGPDHLDTLVSMGNLACTLWERRFDSETEHAKAHVSEPVRTAVQGSSAPSQRRMQRAIEMMEDCTDRSRRVLGASHPATKNKEKVLASWINDVCRLEHTCTLPG